MEIIVKKEEYIKDFLKLSNVNVFNDFTFKEKNIVILGNFDGVHLGHIELINNAIKRAKELNLKVLLYTFREYPKKKDSLITSLSEKLYILNNYDIDYIYLEEFEDIKEFEPLEFINKILIDKLNVEEVFCGFNYTFAKNKKGDIELLSNILKNKVNIINPVIYNLKTDEKKIIRQEELKFYLDKGYYIISSTFIKTLIESGNMEMVEKLLSHEYIIMGKVVHGKKIARTLGFPTANIPAENRKYPIFGVYGVKVKVEGYDKEYYGIMNIGRNPTLENEGIHIETHIFDFTEDIYDKIIVSSLIKNIRLERKMSSLEELKKQILSDEKIWRNIINEKY